MIDRVLRNEAGRVKKTHSVVSVFFLALMLFSCSQKRTKENNYKRIYLFLTRESTPQIKRQKLGYLLCLYKVNTIPFETKAKAHSI